MATEVDLILDCIHKGFEVTFKSQPGETFVECCVERPGQFRNVKPFSGGSTVFFAIREAARYASVPGY